MMYTGTASDRTLRLFGVKDAESETYRPFHTVTEAGCGTSWGEKSSKSMRVVNGCMFDQ